MRSAKLSVGDESRAQRHCHLLAAYARGTLSAEAREELGAWLDNDWLSLSAEEQQMVDSREPANVVGSMDLPDLGDGMPHRVTILAGRETAHA